MKKIIAIMIASLSMTVIATIVNNQIESGSEIFADDLNQMFAQVETALSNNSELTNITFTDYTPGEDISRDGTNGILTKLYTITELYPNSNELDLLLGYEDASGNTVVDFLNGNYINSGELNDLFTKVISDVNNYTPPRNIEITMGRQNIFINDLDNQKLYGMGWNLGGSLGIGNTTYNRPLTQIINPTGEYFTQVAADLHTCGVTNLNKLYCWGRNASGQLGNGTSGSGTELSSPTHITGVSDVKKVVTGSLHTCILTNTGDIYCWGENSSGQVGNNDMPNDAITPQLVAKPTGVTSFKDVIAYQGRTTCALDQSDKLYCWGYMASGIKGDGGRVDDTAEPAPIEIASTFSWSSVSMNTSEGICANELVTNDTYCWGNNSSGEGGVGDNTNIATPTFIGQYSEISSGFRHRFAKDSSGNIVVWGGNFNGEYGDGTNTNSYLVPTTIDYSPINFNKVYAGHINSCALTNSKVYCWGEGGKGQLGTGTTADSYTPVLVTIP